MAADSSNSHFGPVRCLWDARAELGEGVLWSVREQAVYWVDIVGQTLYRYGFLDGRREAWPMGQAVSSLVERNGAEGLVLTLRHSFAAFYPQSGRMEVLHAAEKGHPGNRFNDGKCDARGRYWAATIDADCVRATGALYRYTGRSHCQRMHPGFVVTNGPTWSLDGRTLYLNDTLAGRVMAFDFDLVRGTLTRERTWLQFAPGDGLPDGMTTDASGRIWIARWGGSCVSCHHADDGRELARVELPVSQPTNCVFGGPQLQTLLVTSARVGLTDAQRAQEPLAGGLFAVDTSCVGLAAHGFVAQA